MKAHAAVISSPSPADWSGPGAPDRARRVFSWQTLVWSLVFPPKRHRIGVTLPGIFLIGLAMGIGTAAYNTASNILFITLSLLLACLLLSGLMSWFNFMGLCWRLRPTAAWRAGHETIVTVEVKNTKRWLPTYGLWFDLATHPRAKESDPGPDLSKERVREILAAAEKAVTRGRVFLRERIEPGADLTLEWVHKPEQRGEHVLELAAIGSFFPFGFLRKSVGTGLRRAVLVWPAQIEYQWRGAAAATGGAEGVRSVRAGAGEDLLALRRYQSGDSHRLVHWKASARLGQLMVRQFAAESPEGYALCVEAAAELWTRAEQFETLCRFAATLAEDLFADGRLRGVSVNGQWVDTRRLRDVEAVLDLLAVAEPVGRGLPTLPRTSVDLRDTAGSGEPTLHPLAAGRASRPDEPRATERLVGDDSPYRAGGDRRDVSRNLITFAPEGARGVTAYVDGVPTASA
ncbi:MAG: DUF58 domain-containing protein [Opitutae bacterium]|nr:DUF58 domain-containing protein [Opitutae bacterium]